MIIDSPLHSGALNSGNQGYLFGPQVVSQNLSQYQKSQSSITPDQQDLKSEYFDLASQNRIAVPKLTKDKVSFRRFKTNKPPIQVQSQFHKSPTKKSNLFGFLRKNTFIKKFKQNLFLKSYVLPFSKKSILDSELYLQENQNKLKNDEQEKNTSLLQPGSQLLLIFDTYTIFILIISLWLVPLISSFQQQQDFAIFPAIIFLISIGLETLVAFNRAIIEQGEIIQDRKILIRRYISQELYQDLLMLIVWLLYIFQFQKIQVLNEIIAIVSIILIMKKLSKKYFTYIEFLYLKGAANILIDLITLVILIYFYAHIMACIWHYLGQTYASYFNTTWLIKYDIIEYSMWQKYNYSFYWATVTIVTIGYGDITPQNQLELGFASFMILISSCVYAYLMNSIGILLKTINDSKFKYRKQMALMSSYMKKNLVKPHIQERVKNFIKFNLENEQLENQDEIDQIIETLPTSLKSEMLSEIQKKIIGRIHLLKQNFSKKLLSKISEKLICTKFAPGDFIYKQQDIQEENLYFILDGKIELQEEKSKKQLQILSSNECFGEYQFFTGFPPKVTAVSKSYSDVCKISRNAMLESLKELSKDSEKFHYFCDTISLDQNFQSIFLRCCMCSKYDHQVIDCSMISYKPDLEQRIKKPQFNCNQERQFRKRNSEKCNSLINQRDIMESIRQYKEEQEQNNSENELLKESSESSQNQEDIGLQIQIQESQNFIPITKLLPPSKVELAQPLDTPPKTTTLNYTKPMNLGKQTQQLDRQRPSINDFQLMNQQPSKLINENILDVFIVPLQFHTIVIDKIMNFRYYYPEYNSTEIAKNHNKIIRSRKVYQKQIYESLTNYTINQSTIERILSVRKPSKSVIRVIIDDS